MGISLHHLPLLPAMASLAAAVLLWDDGASGAAPVPGVAYAQLDMPAHRAPMNEDFDSFWRDDDNPFVPYKQRQDASRSPGGQKGWRDPASAPDPQPEPQPPGRALPLTQPGRAVLPVPVGYCSGDRHTWIRVRDPRTGLVSEIEPGASLNGFVFTGIEAGNIAVFKDETERVYRLVIGTR